MLATGQRIVCMTYTAFMGTSRPKCLEIMKSSYVMSLTCDSGGNMLSVEAAIVFKLVVIVQLLF